MVHYFMPVQYGMRICNDYGIHTDAHDQVLVVQVKLLIKVIPLLEMCHLRIFKSGYTIFTRTAVAYVISVCQKTFK